MQAVQLGVIVAAGVLLLLLDRAGMDDYLLLAATAPYLLLMAPTFRVAPPARATAAVAVGTTLVSGVGMATVAYLMWYADPLAGVVVLVAYAAQLFLAGLAGSAAWDARGGRVAGGFDASSKV